MERKANFCKQEKLQQAMTLFWSKGYANTSINDLIEVLGINRFSLYNTFGDKETLYYLALDNYLEQISFPKLTTLREPDSGLEALQDFLLLFAEKQKDNTCGCFIQNAVVEHAATNAMVLKRSDSLFDTLEKAIADVLNNAKLRQELESDTDVSALTQFIICHMQGIRVLGKAKRYDNIDIATKMLIRAIK